MSYSRFDVIVSGAGPAGSTAARECAARGLRTLLLEKAEFPRDKPCGGGVNVRSARLLPFDLGSVVERTIYGLYVSVHGSSGFELRSGKPLSYLTQRRNLDSLLARQAIYSGATLKERAPVRQVEREGSRWLVTAGGDSYRGNVLIAADGANGPTAQLADLTLARWKGIALEGNITPNRRQLERWEDTFAVDVGGVPGGYGWLFPKGDHLNIGVGGWGTVGPSIRDKLERVTGIYGFDSSQFWGLRGHPLPVRKPGSRLVGERVLAVGDAAGLVDPLTGEGIYSAIWSGIAAARHVADMINGDTPDLTGYEREIGAGLVHELEAALQFRDIFHLSPAVWAALLRRSDRVWSSVCRLLTGDLTYLDIKQRYPGMAPAVDAGVNVVRLLARALQFQGADAMPAPFSRGA